MPTKDVPRATVLKIGVDAGALLLAMANHKRFLIPCDIGASIVVELANLRPLTLPEQKMLALELGESSDSWLAFNADIAWSDDIARTRFGSQLIGAIDTHRGTLVIWG